MLISSIGYSPIIVYSNLNKQFCKGLLTIIRTVVDYNKKIMGGFFMTKTIYLVRHGESQGNYRGFFQGWLDCRLTDEGIKQAELLASFLYSRGIQCIISSPLIRAYETAQIIARKCNIETVIRLEEFKELNCGIWQGLTKGQVKRIDPKQAYNFLYKPDKLKIPGGESLLELQKRAMQGFEKVLFYCKEKDNICIVAHGYLNKVILCGLLKQPLNNVKDFPQGNTAVNTLKYNGQFEIVCINSLKHLKKYNI